MINSDCSEIKMVIISFGQFELDKYLDMASKMLEKYASGKVKNSFKVGK